LPVKSSSEDRLRKKRSNTTTAGAHLRVERLTIHNFKAIELLELTLPVPRMKDDPDIIVMGSENGVGKTSVLEALAFLLWALGADGVASEMLSRADLPFDFPDLLVRAGSKEAEIEADLVLKDEIITYSVALHRDGQIKIKPGSTRISDLLVPTGRRAEGRDLIWRGIFPSLAGLSPDPLVLPRLLYFHSYRKIQEGRTELGMMVEDTGQYRRSRFRPLPNVPNSAFKVQLLRSMMSRGGLFENMASTDADAVLDKLNDLMREFAHGAVEKLRPLPDNTVEFRVTPVGGSESFPFDGLSSGQKEIISTLFLIWHETLGKPGLVLIDEPELHLNAEWHRRFIHNLHALAPDNQYLIATHSEDIFASVEADRRLLLRPNENPR